MTSLVHTINSFIPKYLIFDLKKESVEIILLVATMVVGLP